MILHFFKLFFKGISFFQKNKASILLNAAYFQINTLKNKNSS